MNRHFRREAYNTSKIIQFLITNAWEPQSIPTENQKIKRFLNSNSRKSYEKSKWAMKSSSKKRAKKIPNRLRIECGVQSIPSPPPTIARENGDLEVILLHARSIYVFKGERVTESRADNLADYGNCVRTWERRNNI